MNNQKNHGQKTVLLVDDEPYYHHVYGEALRQAHFNVIETESGAEAMRLVRNGGVDAVVLDLLMPGASGMTFLKYLDRRHAPPVAVLTSLDSAMDRQDALKLGASTFLVKYRTTPQNLCATVERLVGEQVN